MKRKPSEPKVRVIVDPRDARKDEFLPASEARRLYNEGKLAYDITNGTYCKE